MPIKITLRKNEQQSPFRHMLNMLLSSPNADSAILCSGYIWQPADGRYNILDDGLRAAIVSGCSQGNLITVAGKFSPAYYEDYYRNFVVDIRSCGVRVQAFYAPKKNWHAKVAIRISKNNPVAALVGSSNLTGPAYGLNRNWNYEADVLIWDDIDKQTTYYRNDEIDLPLGKIEAVLAPDIEQYPEHIQLKGIYEDVMNTEMEEFE